MKECEEIQELISLLLDGELSEAEEQAVREHIAECEECREMYEAFAAVSGAMRADAAQVPAPLHEKIMNGVRAAKKKKPGRIIHLRSYAAAAACLVVVLGAALALGRGGIGFNSASSGAAAAEDQRSSDTAADNESIVMEESGGAEVQPAEFNLQNAGTANDEMPAPQTAGYGYESPALLSARLVRADGERTVEDLDGLAGLLGEQPGESAESVRALSGDADCLLYLETAEGERELSLYFRGESVYVLTDDGTAYQATGTAQEFREIE